MIDSLLVLGSTLQVFQAFPVDFLLICCAEGRDYLAAMAAAANYAWVNRSSMTFLARQAFAKQFEVRLFADSLMTLSVFLQTTPDDLDMHVIYDVSHNIAKVSISPSCLYLTASFHLLGGTAHGGWEFENVVSPQKGQHSSLPPSPPADSC